MTAIFLSIITVGVIIFFAISHSVTKYLPNKRLRYGSLFAYFLQFIGLLGLIVYHVEFMSSPPLTVQFNTNSPDFIRALAELLWPVSLILAIFWFLPQILDFLKDPRKSVPVLAAFSGRHAPQEQQSFLDSFDTKKLPQYANLEDAHKEVIEWIEVELQKIPQNEERARLLIFAADRQLLADFERVYNVIYGSQIQALQMLSTNSKADISSFYETHKQKTEEAIEVRQTTFKEWARLLLETGLVIETENKFTLSNKGKAFLKFLDNRGYYLLRAF